MSVQKVENTGQSVNILACGENIVSSDRWASISVIEMLAQSLALGTMCECYRTLLMKGSKHFTTLSGIWSALMLQENLICIFRNRSLGHNYTALLKSKV